MASFPSDLPAPLLEGYTLMPVDPSVRTDMEVGGQRVRRRTKARNDRVELSWCFTDAQMSEFRTWFDGYEFTRSNLLTYSEQFENAAWSKTRATISTNVTAAPDGAISADKLIVDATAGVNHYTRVTCTIAANEAHTFSVFFKAAEHPNIELRLYDSATGTNGCSATFRSSGVVTGGVTLGTGQLLATSIISVGDGWWRASLTGKSDPAVTLVRGQITVSNSSGTTIITDPTATQGVYIWGAQLEHGSSATNYIKTTSSAVTVPDSYGISGGASWFDIKLNIGLGGATDEEARFSQMWKAQRDSQYWKVSATVEIR